MIEAKATGPRQSAHPYLGWDIGGAHLKAALVKQHRVIAAAQVSCELWRGIEALDQSYASLPDWAHEPGRHAVTMTGELCDFFPDRSTGVAVLVSWAMNKLTTEPLIYAGRAGFLRATEISGQAIDIASANWHATASLVGFCLKDALVCDVGSTTTDLIPVSDGVPVSEGYTDAERLTTGELVYTGVVRTPVMALAQRVPFLGKVTGVVAEHFATIADVYRLLDCLPADADQQATADARSKSFKDTCMRLARMIGHDAADADAVAWRALASHFAELQLRQIETAAFQVLSRAKLAQEAPLVGCGVGRFVARNLAERLGRPYRDLAGLLDTDPAAELCASSYATAAAVALLAARHFAD
jgi:(4-(4-[2-(gamma-L-glutamylamino)ethyl]phenoxymethyl)furan-2-yl)methanamine synthase